MILYPHSHGFSCSVWYSVNSMRYPALRYKIGFVLDDFAQLQAIFKCSECVKTRLSYDAL